MSTGSHSSATDHKHHFAHHFKDATHEFLSSKEGIWLFMVTEILMFGGLFVGYFLMHALYPATFAEGASHLDWKMGSINTVVLIVSSWTMALSIHFIQVGKNKKATLTLITTLICGATFMCIKYMEYSHKFHDGLLPGKFFHNPEAVAQNLGLYFGFYFIMTGLHGTHVLVGMGLITWVLIRNLRGDFNPHYFTPVEGVGIFWHIVDLIWIFLFPLLYLIG
ncbi:MAG: cytochrome C oxidase subunit III [Bdellovibrio sp. CG10_big_fil_rev_8_21_14_0_10_47_8]|nr:MAG: cytochrome C oxidase subunit III [Bdellovibrio sp. CG10_big_fil_rev_8_21_14_0_10_47_8]